MYLLFYFMKISLKVTVMSIVDIIVLPFNVVIDFHDFFILKFPNITRFYMKLLFLYYLKLFLPRVSKVHTFK